MRKEYQLAFYLLLAFLLIGMSACGGGSEGEPAEPGASATGDAPAGDVAEGPTGSSSITGTINYQGEIPQLRPISMDADPGCAAKHDTAVEPEILVLGDGNTMANVMVRVVGGLPEGSWAPPSEAAVMDQEGCRYIPHVMGVMVGQTVRILNSDGLLHNVHALPEVNAEFNMAMPATRTEAERVFDQVEDPFRIKCDVHPWMGAYVAVLPNPFFDVTEEDGEYEVSDLPAGTYEVEAWHERLGTQTASVTVGEGETSTADFTFSRGQ